MSRFRFAAAAVVAAGLLIAGCTDSTPDPDSTAAGTSAATEAATDGTAAETTASDLEIVDPWVKAVPEGTMMTGAFGTIVNNSDEDIHVIAVTSPITDRAELHETVTEGGTPVMKEMEDGFTVEAGEEFVLEPGGNHLMLMELMAPIEAGEDVELTLEFADGRTFSWTAPARTYDGANESYMNSEGEMEDHGTMGGMEPTEGATMGESTEPSPSPTN